MADQKPTTAANTPPAPEVLKPQTGKIDAAPVAKTPAEEKAAAKAAKHSRRGTYRPSHKATFIGLAVVVAILGLNAGVISFIMRNQGNVSADTNRSEVTLSASALDKIGVNKTTLGNAGEELVVGPNSRFNGTVTMNSDVSIAGQLRLNSKFSASDASLAQLQAGKTSLESLDVNGDATVSNFNLRKDLSVVGATKLQGPVTIGQLLTVTNNVNVSGNLAVGGILSVRGFSASSLASDTTLTIGGHILTRPVGVSATAGNALGTGGTMSVSGSDAAGTVSAGIGVGAQPGVIATVRFAQPYSGTPHVIVTPVGVAANVYILNRSGNGFTIAVSNALPPGGFAFDYIVMQ